MLESTIVGQATANGIGALNLIRVSGEDAIRLVNGVFQGKDLEQAAGNEAIYGHIMDGKDTIDEVIAILYRAPHSYTRENMVEITCHGGFFVASEIIRLLIRNGARLAERGEFTRRAFLNGRIDLTEAESVMDIINAKNKAQLDQAQKALRGDIKVQVDKMQNDLLGIIAQIEVNIDYPEYDDVEVITDKIVIPKIKDLIVRIETAIASSQTGKIIRDGIKTVIAGKPNVGKSSLLNSLLREEKAIVTEISGTTRDLIEAEMDLDGIILKLIDTAGIRETADIIEKIGIERTKKAIADADLVLLVLDQSESLTGYDKELLNLTKDKVRILVGNKADLGKKIDPGTEKIINISAKNRVGIDLLAAEVRNLFLKAELGTSNDEALFANARHIAKLQAALSALKDALAAAENHLPIDMAEIDLKAAWDHLGEITGENSTDVLISTLFSRFCLGK